MVDAVIIHPGAQRIIYGDLSDTHTALEPPPWTRMIAGWLRDHGFSIAVIDQEAEGLTTQNVAVRVQGLNPRLAVIAAFGHQPSASTQQMSVRASLPRLSTRRR